MEYEFQNVAGEGGAMRHGSGAGSGRRAGSPPRGALAGIRRDATRNVLGATPLPSGGAWSNSFLNGKSWHPMNYKSQAALYEAEQREAKRKQAEEKAKAEFLEQQELFRNMASLPGKEQKKLRAAQEVSFLYQKPPGYDAMREREAKTSTGRDGETAAAPEAGASAGRPPEPAASSDGRPRLGAPLVRIQCLRCRGFGHEAAACTQPRVGQPLQGSRLLEDPLTLMRAREALQQHAKFEYKGLDDAHAGDAREMLLPPPSSGVEGRSTLGKGAVTLEGPDADGLASLVRIHAAGGDEAVRTALEAMPEKERKRLIKAYDKLRKAERRKREEAAVVAAQAFLQSAGAGVPVAIRNQAKSVVERKSKRMKKERTQKRSRRSDSGGDSTSE